MPAPLLKTRLMIPGTPGALVDRPRLRARLDALRREGIRLGVISAPAGSGKTTLAAHWLRQQDWPAAWVSLDERENTPARFFRYLIAALQPIVPGAGDQAAPLLDLPGASLSEIITLLANDLTEAAGPFLLVLDDFHTITSPAVHQALDELVEAQPPAMRLLLLTREDPSLALARRRAHGQLVELRQEDLRFSLAEAVDFLNQGMGLGLATSQVERLEARTEGWIAGLQLAALSLQNAPDPDAQIAAFSGSSRFILDYLVEEALARQPQAVQQFLLATAIVDRFNASLCQALTGSADQIAQADAAATLRSLEKSNLFLIRLDAEEGWYRYHHLFGELLRVHCQALDPERYLRLHAAASAWYEAHAEPGLAVEFALKAGNPQRAASLIEQHIRDRWHTVDLDFFGLVNRLPAEVVAQRPGLCLHSAWMCVITGRLERVPGLVAAAEAALDRPGRATQPEDTAHRAFACTLRAYQADLNNQPVALTADLAETYAAISEANTGMRNSVAIILGTFHYMEGDLDGASGYFQDALERDRRVEGSNAVPIAAARIAWVREAQGRPHEAASLLREQIEYVRQRGSRRFYISGILDLALAEILLDWNELEETAGWIASGQRLLQDWPSPPVRALGFSLLARLEAAQNRLLEAQAALAQAETLQNSARFHPRFAQAVDRARVQVWTAVGDRAALKNWLIQQQQPSSTSFRYEAGQIERCRALLALDRAAEAVPILERLLAAASERPGSRLRILALLASARAGDLPAAAAVLDQALTLGLTQNAVRTFLEAGKPMRRALESWLQARPANEEPAVSAYARRLIGLFPQPAAQAVLPEPLSSREREVLALAAAGLTNDQIAARLFISSRTVKKHIENINGKLGTHNRTEAAARAREFGVLKG